MDDTLKILVMRYRFLGDTILTVPFLRNLRHRFPTAKIDVLVAPQSGVLLKNCPYVDELIDFDTTRFHRYDSGSGRTLSFWEQVKLVRNRYYDVAYLLKRSFSSALLAYLAGIPRRIGFDTEFRGWLLTERIKFDLARHELLNYLEHLGAEQSRELPPWEPSFWPLPQEEESAEQLLKPLKSLGCKVIMIHAPAAHTLKMWPLERWRDLVARLIECGHGVVLSGTASDAALYESIAPDWQHKPILNLCRTGTTLRENVAIYSKCHAAVCVDSGPMHLAAAVGVPVVGIFGPSDAVRWSPLAASGRVVVYEGKLPCLPCRMKPTCSVRTCLDDLSELQVLEALNDLLRPI